MPMGAQDTDLVLRVKALNIGHHKKVWLSSVAGIAHTMVSPPTPGKLKRLRCIVSWLTFTWVVTVQLIYSILVPLVPSFRWLA